MIAEHILKAAVALALESAATMLMGPLTAAAATAITTRLTAAARSKAIQVGDDALDAFIADYRSKINLTAYKIENGIKKVVDLGVNKAFQSKNGALDPIEAFYEAQRLALIDGKQQAQDQVNANEDQFSGEAGFEMAMAMQDAIDAAGNVANDMQYMASLAKWSSVAQSSPRVALNVTLPGLWEYGKPPVIGSVNIDGNDAIKHRLQNNGTIRDTPLRNFDFAMRVTLATPWKPFAGSSGWSASGRTTGLVDAWPKSGGGAYDLYAFSTGHDFANRQGDDPDMELGAMAGASKLSTPIGKLTWGELPRLK